MTKESNARENIDRLLKQAGWSVCNATGSQLPRATTTFRGKLFTEAPSRPRRLAW